MPRARVSRQRPDAHDLAVELVGGFQGGAVLSSALGQPALMAGQARRLQRWIDALPAGPGDAAG